MRTAESAPVKRLSNSRAGCRVPSDVSWPAFLEYGRRLAELTGWL